MSITSDVAHVETPIVTVTILNLRPLPTLQLTSDGGTYPEGGSPVTFTASISGPSSLDVTASISFSNTAQLGVNYMPLENNITIPAGLTSVTFDVDVLHHYVCEGDKQLNISLYSIENCQVGNVSTYIIIQDVDVVSQVSLLQTQANNATFSFGLQIYQFCMGLDLGLGVSHRNCTVRSSLQKAHCVHT